VHRKKVIVVFIASLVISFLQAQEDRLIQFTGRVFDDFLQPLPSAHIIIKNSKKGGLTDKEGKFSFIAHPLDTISFSVLGFKKSLVVVPTDLKEPFFTRDILMQRDTFMIAAVEVYPWKNYEEFKEAFLNLRVPEDDLERARRNIALIKTQLILQHEPSPTENFNFIMQKQLDQTYVRGTYPTYQLFNIFAWEKFIEALKNGDFKNK
jgi:hypothetical protein